MAKDPAFLMYSSDFLVGTSLMTHEQVGKYIRLLLHQHQRGRLTEQQVLLICGGLDEEVMSKFTKDKSGNYYNKRLEEEAEKRKKYSDSRRENRLKGKQCQRKKPITYDTTYDDTYVLHMENENVNENEDVNKDNVISMDIGEEDMKKPNPPKDYDEVLEYAKYWKREDIALKFWEHFVAGDWYDSEGKPVLNWKQKFVTWKNRNTKQSEVVDEKERAYQKAMEKIHGKQD